MTHFFLLLASALFVVHTTANADKKPAVSITAYPGSITTAYPQYRSTLQLIPYIFFGEDSADIPMRYSRITPEEAAGFTDSLSLETLDIHYHMLNILGYRMRKYPEATITCTGCNADTMKEKNNLPLSRTRAEAVRHYLISVWDIAPDRIAIKARNSPSRSSNRRMAEGLAENRRVEISSKFAEILAPTVTRAPVLPSTDTLRIEAQLKNIRDIQSCQWTIRLRDRPVYSTSGTCDVRNTGFPSLQVAAAQFAELSAGDTLVVHLRVVTANGTAFTNNTPVPCVMAPPAEQAVHLIRLTLFDLNRDSINAVQTAILRTYARPFILPNSLIFCMGSSDFSYIGCNNWLQLGRAKSVAGFLCGTPSCKVRTNSCDEPLFDLDIPEGRMYQRCVIAIIETPGS